MAPEVSWRAAPLDAVAAEEWDRVARGLYLSHGWLSATIRPGGTTVAVLVHVDGEPAAAAVVHRLEAPAYSLQDPVALLAPSLPGFGQDGYPAAVCMSGAGLTQGIAPGGGEAAVEALLDALDGVADEWGVRTRALLYLEPPAEAALARPLTARGFAGGTIDGRAVMAPLGRTFERHLAALKAPRRRMVKLELRAFAAAGLSLRRLDAAGIAADVERLANLAARVQERHGNPFDPATSRATLELLLARRPDLLHALVAADGDGRAVAFHLLYRGADGLYSAFTGQDYGTASLRGFAHFVLLYYEPLRIAAEAGLGRIDYGLGIRGDHVSRGGEIVPVRAWVRAPGRWQAGVAEALRELDDAARRRIAAATTHRARRVVDPPASTAERV